MEYININIANPSVVLKVKMYVETPAASIGKFHTLATDHQGKDRKKIPPGKVVYVSFLTTQTEQT